MYPLIRFDFAGQSFALATNTLLTFIALVMCWSFFAKTIGRVRSFALVAALFIAAMIGGRLFHVIVERPDLLQTPERIFTRFDGMTFYGAFLGGAIVLAALLSFARSSVRLRLLDDTAFATALSYGLLRIGCFANGCCWGKISDVPWAIEYHDTHSVMPLLGLPVHPVQLYDSIAGFAIALVLHSARSRFSGRLMPLFLMLYSVARSFTEVFRGDEFRGTVGVLSTSQFISVGLFLSGALWFFGRRLRFGALASALLLTGCLPHAPGHETFEKVDLVNGVEISSSVRRRTMTSKDVIVIIADTNIAKQYSAQTQSKFGSVVPIEELTWWKLAPDLARVYRHVIRIPSASVTHDVVVSAIDRLNSLGRTFDLVILSHGMPNYLTVGTMSHFFGWEDLQAKRWPSLDMVYLQSCYGTSLDPDFVKAGAKTVIAFDDEIRNFFFYPLMLKQMTKRPLAEAYRITRDGMAPLLRADSIYPQLLKMMGTNVDEYVAHVSAPTDYLGN